MYLQSNTKHDFNILLLGIYLYTKFLVQQEILSVLAGNESLRRSEESQDTNKPLLEIVPLQRNTRDFCLRLMEMYIYEVFRVRNNFQQLLLLRMCL